jgi:hypothetical protein
MQQGVENNGYRNFVDLWICYPRSGSAAGVRLDFRQNLEAKELNSSWVSVSG